MISNVDRRRIIGRVVALRVSEGTVSRIPSRAIPSEENLRPIGDEVIVKRKEKKKKKETLRYWLGAIPRARAVRMAF